MVELTTAVPELGELGTVSNWLAHRGWSEASAGNASLRLEGFGETALQLADGPPQPLPLKAPELSGRHLLITASGARARETAQNPSLSVGLYRVQPGGEAMICLWGNASPSREMPAHLAIQRMLVKERPEHRAVLHTHPANFIALTHLPELQDSLSLSDALLRMQSEAQVILPEGLRYLPHHLPGSVELAEASAEALRGSCVLLWHMHGAVATGETLSRALDYLEYVDKAAEVYWRLRTAGIRPAGMTEADIQKSLEHFGRWDRYQQSRAHLTRKANP